MTLASTRIAHKLPAILVLLAMLSAALTGALAYVKSSREMVAAADAKLAALMESRQSELDHTLAAIQQDAIVLAGVRTVTDAMAEFGYGYGALSEAQATLDKLYVSGNPNPAGQRQKLDNAGDTSDYSEIHSRYHGWFRRILETRGYQDLFLIDANGVVVYSVAKQPEFATSLDSGRWKDESLADLYRRLKAAAPGSTLFADYRPYGPAGGAPASFIGAQVTQADGTFLGVLVLEMPVERINAVLQMSTGMGESGDTYLVGPDNLMRSQSRVVKEPTILKRRVETGPVRAALAGRSGIMEATGLRGTETLAAYGPLTFLGVTWAVVAESDLSETLAPVYEMRTFMLVGGALLMVVVVAVGMLVARGITGPLDAMTRAMAALADGDKTVIVPATERHDEIGEMAKAMQVFKDNALAVDRMQAEQAEAKARTAAERRDAMMRLADSFEAGVKGVVDGMAASAGELQSTAQTMSATAAETSRQSHEVAEAAQQASVNVQTVAVAAEELSSSISEIARQVSQSSRISAGAVEEASRTNAMVQGLAEAAARIGEVVNLINDIASQTNLLALNATIEAARAGEAGKGFAVVANEVKNLANQTARATDEITTQIHAVQSATRDAVGAIQGIRGTIGEISQIASTIAGSIDAQGLATQQIARNVQEAATGTQRVTGNIAAVWQAAESAGQAAGQVLNSAGALSRQSEQLHSHVVRFLETVREE